MALTTRSILPPPVQKYFDDALLSFEKPNLIYKIPATKDIMPQKKGSVLRKRRYDRFEVDLTPLGEDGQEGPPQNANYEDIDVDILFYGKWAYIVDQVTLTNQDPVLNQYVKLHGYQMRETEDALVRQQLLQGASSIDCIGGSNDDNPTEISLSDIDDVIQSLIGSNARMISEMIEAEDKYGTAPVYDAFFAMGHTKLLRDLQNVEGFDAKWKYPNQQNVLPSEWGAVRNIRFLLTSKGAIEENASMNGNDVLDTIVTGVEAYGCVDQEGYGARFIYTDPKIAGGPLQNKATVAWSTAFGTRVWNHKWVKKVRSTQTQ